MQGWSLGNHVQSTVFADLLQLLKLVIQRTDCDGWFAGVGGGCLRLCKLSEFEVNRLLVHLLLDPTPR